MCAPNLAGLSVSVIATALSDILPQHSYSVCHNWSALVQQCVVALLISCPRRLVVGIGTWQGNEQNIKLLCVAILALLNRVSTITLAV